MLGPSKSLRRDVRKHLVRRLILKHKNPFLYIFAHKVKLYVDVLCSCMEDRIFCQRDATLIVFIEGRRSKFEANVGQ